MNVRRTSFVREIHNFRIAQTLSLKLSMLLRCTAVLTYSKSFYLKKLKKHDYFLQGYRRLRNWMGFWCRIFDSQFVTLCDRIFLFGGGNSCGFYMLHYIPTAQHIFWRKSKFLIFQKISSQREGRRRSATTKVTVAKLLGIFQNFILLSVSQMWLAIFQTIDYRKFATARTSFRAALHNMLIWTDVAWKNSGDEYTFKG